MSVYKRFLSLIIGVTLLLPMLSTTVALAKPKDPGTPPVAKGKLILESSSGKSLKVERVDPRYYYIPPCNQYDYNAIAVFQTGYGPVTIDWYGTPTSYRATGFCSSSGCYWYAYAPGTGYIQPGEYIYFYNVSATSPSNLYGYCTPVNPITGPSTGSQK